jgi:proliferating cell nuclear antigen PCNA
MTKAEIMKKVMDSLKDLIKEAVWDVNGESLSLQSMDSSHVSLVMVTLMSEGFESFRCDKNLALGGKLFFANSSLIFSEHGHHAETNEMRRERRRIHHQG